MTPSGLVLRLATPLVTFVFAAGVWSSTAQAQPTRRYPLSGNARLQIGVGPPFPIGFTPAPNGRIHAVPGAVVVQTTGPDPKQMMIPPGQLTAPGTPVVIGMGGNVFQVQTAIALSFPGAGPWGGGTFQAGGRTGAPTVTFCPGTGLVTPPCVLPAAIPGRMRYTKTAAQFGGRAQHAAAGTANMAMRASGTPPCSSCLAVFAQANPPATIPQGAPFSWYTTVPGTAPSPGFARVGVTAGGIITNVVSIISSPGLPNPATSYGGPWTTGMVTITVPSPPMTFVLSGSDARVNGVGSISLVSGALSVRGVSGSSAHRGWLNLIVGAPPIPAVSGPGLAAAFGLLALAGGYLLHRRVR